MHITRSSDHGPLLRTAVNPQQCIMGVYRVYRVYMVYRVYRV
jgi:hypothetical protein